MAQSPRIFGCSVNLPKQLKAGDGDLAATTVKTVTFKDTNDVIVAAKKLSLVFFDEDDPPVVEKRIHYRINSVDVDDDCYFLPAGSPEHTIEIPVNTISFYSTHATVKFFIVAFGDQDMTGTISA